MRYDETVEQGAINHALRFTCPRTRKAYVSPARHYASNDTSSALPAMGMRVRLKANFDTTGFTPNVRVILRAMMRYGMFVADNGSGWFVSGAPDPRWNDDELAGARARSVVSVRSGEVAPATCAQLRHPPSDPFRHPPADRFHRRGGRRPGSPSPSFRRAMVCHGTVGG